MKLRTRSIPAALTLSLAVTLGACSEPVSTAAKPCPCASGYVCCESGVCAADQDSCGVATAALSSEAQGHWTGYVEGTGLFLESDALDFTFDVDAAGELRGRIVVGDGPLPPAPTQAHADLPATGIPFTRSSQGGDLSPSIVIPANGFPYTARNVHWQARRLRFEIVLLEALEDWCALQPPSPLVYEGGVAYRIGPGSYTPGGVDANGKSICLLGDESGPQASCDWLFLDSTAVCSCTASACAATQLHVYSFDIALRGDEGDGSLGAVGGASSSNLRLVRASR